jgi:hypothetical protein
MQSLSASDLTYQRLIVAVHSGDDATGQEVEGCFTAYTRPNVGLDIGSTNRTAVFHRILRG